MIIKKHPKIAILMAVYNGMLFIEDQINSILAQKNVQLDIYISVDKSNDGSYEWCKNFSKKNTNIQILPYGKRYGSSSSNFFRLFCDVEFEGYDFISLADQDDIWLSNKLNHAVTVMRNNSIKGFSSDVLTFDKNGKQTLIKKSFNQKKYDYYFESAGPGCTYVLNVISAQKFKSFLISNFSKLNKINNHDWLIYAFFRKKEMKWHIDSKPMMRYRNHGSNLMGPNIGLAALLKRLNLINTNWYSNEVYLILSSLSSLSPKDDSMIIFDKVFLVKNFLQLRRSPKEAYFLLFMLLTNIIKINRIGS